MAHVRAWPTAWDAGTWVLALFTCFIWLIAQYFMDESAKKRAQQLCGPQCVRPDAAVAYLGWNGTVQSFDISSRFFAYELILANPRNAVNVSYDMQAELQRYAAYKQGQRLQAVSAPAAHALQSPPGSADEQFLISTLERLASLKGQAARRAAVEAALPRLQDPRLRERLLVEAARIEVQAVFEKVDSLKSPAAKRRHLEAALEQIRNDPVPDQLQGREIAALEQALRELPR
jgi:hypothetical protein